MPLKEESIPVDERGQPDLSHYTDSVEYYAEMYGKFLASLRGEWPWNSEDRHLPWNSRVHSTWGLIAKGPGSISFAIQMLRHREPEAREDGAAILGAIGKDESVVSSILASLTTESDTGARDSLILALGGLRSRSAIPALASIIRDATVDGDTRFTAAESLGKIVRRRFLKQPHPIAAAIEWLDKHPQA